MSKQDLSTALNVPLATVSKWWDDLSAIAADCLATLDPTQRDLALYYLTGYYIRSDKGQVTSESLGDASMSYAQRQASMTADPYGKMALSIAPCLAGLSVTRQMTVWLV